MIEWHGDGGAKAKGDDESERRNKGGGPSVPLHKPNIDFEANEEQEQRDTNIAGKDKKGKGRRWEDGLGETGNATHD